MLPKHDGRMTRDGKPPNPSETKARKGDYLACRFCHKAVMKVLIDITGYTPVNPTLHFVHTEGRRVKSTDPMGCPYCGIKSEIPDLFQFFAVRSTREYQKEKI